MKKASKIKAPASVSRILASARQAGGPATLIFRLAKAADLSPEDVKQSVDALMTNAADSSGGKPLRLKVLANLGFFTVSAPAAFLEALARSPEVASVQPAKAALEPIAPVRRGPVNPKGWA